MSTVVVLLTSAATSLLHKSSDSTLHGETRLLLRCQTNPNLRRTATRKTRGGPRRNPRGPAQQKRKKQRGPQREKTRQPPPCTSSLVPRRNGASHSATQREVGENKETTLPAGWLASKTCAAVPGRTHAPQTHRPRRRATLKARHQRD